MGEPLGKATIMGTSRIHDAAGSLTGLICTRVENSVGSVLLIDFGNRGRGPLQADSSEPQGFRTLLVESPWRLESDSAVLCDWNARNQVGGELERCVRSLVGATVQGVEVVMPAHDLRVFFNNRVKLIIFADATAYRGHAWSLTGLDGLQIEAGLRVLGA